ncbi:E3 ubiquitin-protein ligase RNF8-like [Rhodamnia argentea]|uniref:E3 ubiquitin-protein ligase RNF8-like n=1 Tax=Rhodamnia argentea TaxID=178133 RepID=A0A8B8PCT8_9MYRT|nr:E3 ubiquitin-protein ligase RNF8-like [Rhodamnia argentea]
MSLIDGSLNRRNSIRGKEEGGGSFLGSGRRDLAGLTLDDVLGTDRKLGPTASVAQITRTLLEVIRDDPEGGSFPDLISQKDKKSWRSFKERLRRRRESQAWTSTVHTPTSDIPIKSSRSQMSKQSLTRFHSTKIVANSDDEPLHCESPTAEEMHRSDQEVVCDSSSQSSSRSMMMRRTSSRFGSLGPDSNEPEDLAGKALRPQISRHNSTRLGSSPWSRSDSTRLLTRSESSMVRREDTNGEDSSAIYGDELACRSRRVSVMSPQEVRQLSAREAAASQEAAEAAAAAVADREEEGSDGEETESFEAAQPKMMSLMDLLEETDREMGLEGSRYVVGDEEDEEEEEELEEEDDGEEGGEFSCCVCMVRHKGSAFIPCGHTFCRMCSRELMVSRGNCPLCNKFILEILDIF